MSDTQFSYSFDQEHYIGKFDTIELALAAANAATSLEPGASITVWVGEVEEIDVAALVDVDQIIEMMIEQASDFAGEAAEGWLFSVTSDQKEELQKLVTDWVQRVDSPSFWGVDAVTTETLTKEA